MTYARRSFFLAAGIFSAAAALAIFFSCSQEPWFVDYPLPFQRADRLFDIGIVDANGDNRLDIYTSNHHFRQVLLLADGHGGYHDVLSAWGLDQSPAFPHAELSFSEPVVDRPGVYIYWIGTQFVIRAHELEDPAKWRGSMQVNDPIKLIKNEGFKRVAKHDQETSVSPTTIQFAPSTNAYLRLNPGGQGLPITFRFEQGANPSEIFVGLAKVSPRSQAFSLAMKDRHAMAWADYNNDGLLDIFIDRGALGGALRAYPEYIRSKIEDELLVSATPGRFVDVAQKAGIHKEDCSGRHARWLDINGDGLLDLFVNCYDRKHVKGSYPKQLYVQGRDGVLHDEAIAMGLGLPGRQLGSFSFFDLDDDGGLDLLTFEDEGLFLYRNKDGHFVREDVLTRSSKGFEPIGHSERNFFDGKVSVADFDADGDLDAFSASNRGNVLMVDRRGRLVAVNPEDVGLPATSLTANWVDYDNDGLPDLHLVPQGLFRQNKDHTFEREGLLDFPADQYHAAICSWFDMDNDGRIDVLMALNRNPNFRHWWQFSRKKSGPSSSFDIVALRNVGTTNHWLQLALVGKTGNRQAIGARVVVVTPEGSQAQEVGASEGSFWSQGHYRLYFGLGPHAKVNEIRIRWPDGHQQELKDVAADRLLSVQE